MRRDLKEYFVTMQKQMNDMDKILEKVKKEVADGLVTEEQVQSFTNYYNVVKINYERTLYIVHLLNLPPRWIQKLQERKLVRDQKKKAEEFKNSTLNDVAEENSTAIKLASEVVENEDGCDE